ncbi:hypothetical protein FB451DRAFT_1387935 [Mycena latifolia]|nr:hypothetical protein FB451DRAFT_1387935 [Mycena latifolia]
MKAFYALFALFALSLAPISVSARALVVPNRARQEHLIFLKVGPSDYEDDPPVEPTSTLAY